MHIASRKLGFVPASFSTISPPPPPTSPTIKLRRVGSANPRLSADVIVCRILPYHRFFLSELIRLESGLRPANPDPDPWSQPTLSTLTESAVDSFGCYGYFGEDPLRQIWFLFRSLELDQDVNLFCIQPQQLTAVGFSDGCGGGKMRSQFDCHSDEFFRRVAGKLVNLESITCTSNNMSTLNLLMTSGSLPQLKYLKLVESSPPSGPLGDDDFMTPSTWKWLGQLVSFTLPYCLFSYGANQLCQPIVNESACSFMRRFAEESPLSIAELKELFLCHPNPERMIEVNLPAACCNSIATFTNLRKMILRIPDVFSSQERIEPLRNQRFEHLESLRIRLGSDNGSVHPAYDILRTWHVPAVKVLELVGDKAFCEMFPWEIVAATVEILVLYDMHCNLDHRFPALKCLSYAGSDLEIGFANVYLLETNFPVLETLCCSATVQIQGDSITHSLRRFWGSAHPSHVLRLAPFIEEIQLVCGYGDRTMTSHLEGVRACHHLKRIMLVCGELRRLSFVHPVHFPVLEEVVLDRCSLRRRDGLHSVTLEVAEQMWGQKREIVFQVPRVLEKTTEQASSVAAKAQSQEF